MTLPEIKALGTYDASGKQGCWNAPGCATVQAEPLGLPAPVTSIPFPRSFVLLISRSLLAVKLHPEVTGFFKIVVQSECTSFWLGLGLPLWLGVGGGGAVPAHQRSSGADSRFTPPTPTLLQRTPLRKHRIHGAQAAAFGRAHCVAASSAPTPLFSAPLRFHPSFLLPRCPYPAAHVTP